MTDKEMMMRRLSGVQFAAWEMHVYLDTHPGDKQALQSFKKYEAEAGALMQEYEAKYGAVKSPDPYGNNGWDWINAPWPWEIEKEVM